MRGDFAVDLADALVGIAVAVGQHVVRRHGIHPFFRAGLGIDVFDPVQLVGKRRDIPRGIAGVRFAIPPLIGVVEAGRNLVGFVRRARVNIEGALRIRSVIVTRTRPADVMARHQRPFESLVDQHVDKVTRVTHLRRKKALRVVGQIAVAAPRFPPCLLEGLDFLAENRFGQKRSERVVVGEAQHVHAGRTGRSSPSAAFADARIPVALVTEMSTAAELADVVDERTRIADGKAAVVVDAVQRIERAELVGALAVVLAEDLYKVIFRMLFRTDAPVVLARFEHDRIPGVLAALVLRAIAVPLRPIKRLVIVPEPGNVNVAVVGKS